MICAAMHASPLTTADTAMPLTLKTAVAVRCLSALDTKNFCNFVLFIHRFLPDDTVPEEFIYPVSRKILLGIAVLAVIVSSLSADTFPSSGPVVLGKRGTSSQGAGGCTEESAGGG